MLRINYKNFQCDYISMLDIVTSPDHGSIYVIRY